MTLAGLVSLAADMGSIVQDKIAAIIAIESASQMSMAGANAEKYRVRVYDNHYNVMAAYQQIPPLGTEAASPIVVVRRMRAQTQVERSTNYDVGQKLGTYWIDCYGYGVATANTSPDDPGFKSDDVLAAIEANRCAYLVEQWLMASDYYDLELTADGRPLVKRRVVDVLDPIISATAMPFDEAFFVKCRRIVLEVEYAQDYIPVEPFILGGFNLKLTRELTGQILIEALVPETTN